VKSWWKNLLWLCLPLMVITTQAQTENEYYICIADDTNMNLLELTASEPVGFIFSRTVNAFVYSGTQNPLIADIIHIDSDTQTGTYRRVNDVLRGAYTTNPASIAVTTDCESRYPILTELQKTILLPLTPSQTLVVHQPTRMIQYETAEGTIIGAVGFYFRDETVTNMPHFQILRFSGGADDRVSISFPDIVNETRLYIVANDRLNQNITDPAGFENQPQFLNSAAQFIARLNRQGEDLLDTIMSRGKFRMLVQYGTEIIYEPGSWINIERLSTFVSREFEVGSIIHTLDCNVDVPYVRQDGFDHFWYLDSNQRSQQSAGRMRGDDFVVTGVRDDGVLLIETSGGEFAVPAWLVTTGEPLNCEPQ
jgi:hypothetical protein